MACLIPSPRTDLVTARKRSLGQGNIFTPVCHSVHRGACVVAAGGCMVAGGGCVVAGGVCMVAAEGGHAWLLRGVCLVAQGGHVWLLRGGVHCCSWGGGMRGIQRDTEIRSMSGRYASYWNAFLWQYKFSHHARMATRNSKNSIYCFSFETFFPYSLAKRKALWL